MKRLFSVRTLRAHLFVGEGWGPRLLGRGASTLFDAGASIFCSGASIFLARARRAYVAPIFRSMGASTFCGDKIGRVYFLYGLVSFLVLARLFFCAGSAVSAWWWEGRAEGVRSCQALHTRAHQVQDQTRPRQKQTRPPKVDAPNLLLMRRRSKSGRVRVDGHTGSRGAHCQSAFLFFLVGARVGAYVLAPLAWRGRVFCAMQTLIDYNNYKIDAPDAAAPKHKR